MAPPRTRSSLPALDDYPLRRAAERLGVAIFRSVREDATGLGLTVREAMILLVLRRNRAVPVSRLVSGSGTPPSTITGVVDALVLAQLLKREHGTRDRRQVVVSLAPRGRQLAERLERLQASRWLGVRGQLPGTRAALAARVLDQAISGFHRSPRPAAAVAPAAGRRVRAAASTTRGVAGR